MKENEKKDNWEKAKIIGSVSTGVVLAVVAIMGSIIIPEKINQHSLEAQWINELSQLVPQLYDSSAVSRPTVMAMASYGAPAVPLLLLVLEDASYKQNEDMLDNIVSTMKYMDSDSKKKIHTRLEMEIDQLDQQDLGSCNLRFIEQMVCILQWPRLFKGTWVILEEYYSVVSKFTDNKDQLSELNGIILKALSDEYFDISGLQLQGLDFFRQDLSGIDFRNTNLRNTNLIESELYGCKFEGAILDSCDMREAYYFEGYEDNLSILNTFKELAKSNWRNAILDPYVYDFLTALDKDPQNIEELYTMVDEIKEGF